jgi:hypothetical protein
MRLQIRSGQLSVHEPANLSMGIEKRTLIISRPCVTNREQGTGLWAGLRQAMAPLETNFRIGKDTGKPGLRSGLAGTIFVPRLPQPFAISSRFQLTYPMTNEDERELETELARLQQEHRDLDAAIDALHQSPAPDLLRLQRLKKRKLQLRDRIAFIEDQITPDIIA